MRLTDERFFSLPPPPTLSRSPSQFPSVCVSHFAASLRSRSFAGAPACFTCVSFSDSRVCVARTRVCVYD